MSVKLPPPKISPKPASDTFRISPYPERSLGFRNAIAERDGRYKGPAGKFTPQLVRPNRTLIEEIFGSSFERQFYNGAVGSLHLSDNLIR